MQNKIDRVNEKLKEFFKEDCYHCQSYSENCERTENRDANCLFRLDNETQKLIDDINNILTKKLPERCANPYTANNCRICKFNIDDESKEYDYFFPSPCKDNNCINFKKKDSESLATMEVDFKDAMEWGRKFDAIKHTVPLSSLIEGKKPVDPLKNFRIKCLLKRTIRNRWLWEITYNEGMNNEVIIYYRSHYYNLYCFYGIY